jgi:hypothetical protein
MPDEVIGDVITDSVGQSGGARALPLFANE